MTAFSVFCESASKLSNVQLVSEARVGFMEKSVPITFAVS